MSLIAESLSDPKLAERTALLDTPDPIELKRLGNAQNSIALQTLPVHCPGWKALVLPVRIGASELQAFRRDWHPPANRSPNTSQPRIEPASSLGQAPRAMQKLPGRATQAAVIL